MAGTRVLGAPEGTALQADLTGTFKRPFPEQVAFFHGQARQSRADKHVARPGARGARFDLHGAGAMKADLLADLAATVDKAVTQGLTLRLACAM
ncbi:hypothetical protein GGR16_000971 [Chelatococcus caeni]|uniref:Uncharacterized protein n=1 Tax=Chelatococcus caeni TaxID=1348468 RepID=A0A840BRG4_9HYPH|nr:hypothetical protein [Chelatococcus caeni]